MAGGEGYSWSGHPTHLESYNLVFCRNYFQVFVALKIVQSLHKVKHSQEKPYQTFQLRRVGRENYV